MQAWTIIYHSQLKVAIVSTNASSNQKNTLRLFLISCTKIACIQSRIKVQIIKKFFWKRKRVAKFYSIIQQIKKNCILRRNVWEVNFIIIRQKSILPSIFAKINLNNKNKPFTPYNIAFERYLNLVVQLYY